jgi:glycosyltransferase involved in cell wall biosynthesis
MYPLRLAWARNADALILYDSERLAWFTERGIAPEKLFLAWNSVDTDRIASLAQDWSASRRYRVLYTGRLIAQKKVDLLLRAFALAAPGLPCEARLTMIGAGPEAAALRGLAENLHILGRTDFVGQVTDEAVLAPYFNTSRMSVSAGGVGLALIHTMAYGVPMLVADHEPHGPEFSALVPEVNGLLFPSDDCEALAHLLVQAFAGGLALAGMSQAARSTVATRYSLGAMVDAFNAAVAYVCSRETQ